MAIRVRTSSGSLLCCFLGAMPRASGCAPPQLRPQGRRALVLCQSQEVRQCPVNLTRSELLFTASLCVTSPLLLCVLLCPPDLASAQEQGPRCRPGNTLTLVSAKPGAGSLSQGSGSGRLTNCLDLVATQWTLTPAVASALVLLLCHLLVCRAGYKASCDGVVLSCIDKWSLMGSRYR